LNKKQRLAQDPLEINDAFATTFRETKFGDGSVVTIHNNSDAKAKLDSKVQGVNGQNVWVKWYPEGHIGAGSWKIVNKEKADSLYILRPTGVPWGHIRKNQAESAYSCSVDALIMLGRYLGLFARENDKPRFMSWAEYESLMFPHQRQFRDLIATDWDRMGKVDALSAKTVFYHEMLKDQLSRLSPRDVQFYDSKRPRKLRNMDFAFCLSPTNIWEYLLDTRHRREAAATGPSAVSLRWKPWRRIPELLGH
jgi:hypothetical protein